MKSELLTTDELIKELSVKLNNWFWLDRLDLDDISKRCYDFVVKCLDKGVYNE